MDHCASVLLAFPSDEALGDTDAYHKAAKSHLVKISHLFKDQGPAIASNAQNLLDVRFAVLLSRQCIGEKECCYGDLC